MSFHFSGSNLIDGAVIEGNGGCGIVDVNSNITIYRNVTVRDNFPVRIIFRGFAHAMYNCRITGNADRQIVVDKGASANFVYCLIAAQGRRNAPRD